ncbi:hypothetical protein ACQ4LE_007154 [Meloidogyne hapla]
MPIELVANILQAVNTWPNDEQEEIISVKDYYFSIFFVSDRLRLLETPKSKYELWSENAKNLLISSSIIFKFSDSIFQRRRQKLLMSAAIISQHDFAIKMADIDNLLKDEVAIIGGHLEEELTIIDKSLEEALAIIDEDLKKDLADIDVLFKDLVAAVNARSEKEKAANKARLEKKKAALDARLDKKKAANYARLEKKKAANNVRLQLTLDYYNGQNNLRFENIEKRVDETEKDIKNLKGIALNVKKIQDDAVDNFCAEEA